MSAPVTLTSAHIDQIGYVRAWRLATDGGDQDPVMRHPGAQVGTCRGNDRRCGGALVPVCPPVAKPDPPLRSRVVFFEAVCTVCQLVYAEARAVLADTHRAPESPPAAPLTLIRGSGEGSG